MEEFFLDHPIVLSFKLLRKRDMIPFTQMRHDII